MKFTLIECELLEPLEPFALIQFIKPACVKGFQCSYTSANLFKSFSGGTCHKMHILVASPCEVGRMLMEFNTTLRSGAFL